MAKKQQPKGAAELLMLSCAPGTYGHYDGVRFECADMLTAADLVRDGLVTFEDDNSCDYGTNYRLVPTDRGWLQFHILKVAEYQEKVNAPKPEEKT